MLAFPANAAAGSGGSFAATFTATAPTIDGSLSDPAWAAATAYPLTFGSTSATVRFLRDASSLYVGVQVADPSVGASPLLDILFDNSHNGLTDVGDDAWLAELSAGEDFFSSDTSGSVYTNDLGSGGTNDTTAKTGFGAGAVSFETKHPLCSPDTAHDLCVSPSGKVVGVDFQYEPGPVGVFYDAPGGRTAQSTWADLTVPGADTTPPTATITSPSAGAVLSGQVPVTVNAADNVAVDHVIYRFNDGSTVRTLFTSNTAPFSFTLDSTTLPDCAPLACTLYAQAVDTSGNTSGGAFGNGIGVGVNNATGSLTGSFDQSVVQPVDVTGAGAEDWAVWGYDPPGIAPPPNSLTPNETKANGGREISNLTIDNGNGTPPTRPFGNQTSVPYNFSWTDGAPDAAVSNGYAGITAPTLGQGLSFTVPADTTPRTLTIWTSAHYADGTLTARLSDGSSPDYRQTIHATAGAPFPTENAPATFTIHYRAGSANQHLTISWDQTANNSCGNVCEDIVLYGAALSGVATGATANFNSGQSVQMSGTVPISAIPLAAFDPQPPGAPPISTQGAQLNQTQLNQTQLNQTQLNQTQLNQTQLNQTQLNQTQLNQSQLNQTQLNQTSPLASQLNQTQLNQTQLNQTQLNQTQLNQTQLNQTQLNQSQLNQTQLNQTPLDPTQFPDGWPGLLQYTNLAGKPLQTLTLHDVMSLTTADVVQPLPNGTTAQDVIDRIQHLTFANLEIQSTSLAQLSLGALLLGDFDINRLGSGLTDPIERQLNEWCLSFAPAGDPHHFCSGDAPVTDPSKYVGGPGIGYFNLIQLTLMGAPVQSLQLNQTQLNQTQLNQTQLNQTQLNQTAVGHLAQSASGIVGMQLSRLDLTRGLGMANRQVNLLGAGVPDTLFDCTLFDCSNGTLADAQTAGAIRPATTVGDLDQGNFFIGVAAAPGVTAVPPVTISQLLDNVLGPNSAYKDIADFGDLVGLYLKANDVQWETLPPNLLAIFDPNRQQLSMSAGFTVQGSGTVPADVKIDLPAGFDYVPGSAALSENPLGEPTITGTAGSGYTLEWQLDAVNAGTPYTLSFDAFAGTTVGPAQATETISSGGFSDSSIAAFSVTDSFPNATASLPAPLDPTAGQGAVELSTLPAAGAVDYYTIPMPPAGERIQVHLTNLPADYDLALYSPRSTSVRTTTNVAPPLQDGIVPDTQVDLNGGSSGQLAPTGLQDAPNLSGLTLVQRSDNRHQDDEDVGMVSPGGGGFVTIAVYGYNGAFSPKAYTLRVKESAPPTTEICAARSFGHAGAGTTPGSLPSLTSLPANLNTIILVDEKRIGDTYGAPDETSAVAALQRLAGDSTLGVSGVVVPVETIPGVQGLYNTWDTNPCDPGAANAVANAIADEVNAIVAARPSVNYLVFGGGDDQIPFFRLPDLSLIANESGFAGQFGPNEYQGSLAAGDLLSDDPYLDTQPVPASGQQLFPPNLAGGRLVETAQDIANAVNSFEHAPTPGTLRSSTGFVSGYDFVADGAQRVATNLSARGVSVRPLLGSATSLFSLSDFLGAAFPTGGPANVNSWNGHYDNYRAQMANGDILSTSGVPAGLDNGIFFTMGCHAGFQTTDAVVGSTVLDWPQYFAQHGTGFVGNTGYGLGDTNSVAFSEELMADFAGKLRGSNTLGQSLLQAKRQYYLSRVAFSNYDQKALSEAELYGLPMYGVGSAPAPLQASLLAAADVPPVTGTTASTSPSQGSLSAFPGTGVQSADFAATPHFVGPLNGTNGGQYFTNDGQVQAPNYRPLQPYVSLPAARSGLVAHGVVIDGLTSSDNSSFKPENVRPTLNSGSTEPPPSFTDEAWPEKIPTLVSLGTDQSLNLITGQFFTDSSSSTGVERLWTQINGRVTYSNSSDFTPPAIDSIDAFQSDPGQSDNVVGFTGQFSDVSGSVVFAQVIYDDAGTWRPVQLQHNPSGLWSAGVPFAGSNLQYFVEVCDGSGNCGYSSNKGNYFDARPLPSGTGNGGSAGTLTISPSRSADTGSWYTGGLTIDAITTAPDATVSVTVDGQPVTATAGITVSGDGAHIVVARDSAGNTASAAYLIDTTGPAITPAVSPAAPSGTNGWYKTAPTVSFACTDNLSGVSSCSGPTTLGQSASPQSVTGNATDNAGNTSQATAAGLKVDLSDPATPTFQGIAAQQYRFGSVPAFGGISCSSSDAISGLHDCTVDPGGYSTAPGSHTLTATATDNSGRKTTKTLTYTVGFSQACLTTTLSGSLTIKSGNAYCIQTGGKVTGSVTVQSGGSLYMNGGTISGTLTSTGATAVWLCGATLSGSVGISTTTGTVLLGGSSGSGCAADNFGSSVTLKQNASGVTMVGDSVKGSLTATGNKGGSLFSGNKITGTVLIDSNSGGVTFTTNTVAAAVTISNTTDGFTFSGNTISGKITLTNNH